MKVLRLTGVDGAEVLVSPKYFHSAVEKTHIVRDAGFQKYTVVYTRSHRDQGYNVKESVATIVEQLVRIKTP
jgi:hypothetical protein